MKMAIFIKENALRVADFLKRNREIYIYIYIYMIVDKKNVS